MPYNRTAPPKSRIGYRCICADCGDQFELATTLNDHTQRQHGRLPTRDERTPKEVELCS